jgi:5-methylcytosine-specific restriction endonuclease McrA
VIMKDQDRLRHQLYRPVLVLNSSYEPINVCAARYTCQYCHKTLNSGELTLDHVIPRSRAGETTWENLVACCHPCNNRKGNRTPEEANMRLARAPRPFSLHTSRHLMRLLGKSDDQWRKYLFY